MPGAPYRFGMDRIGALEIPEDEAELQALLDAGRLRERNAVDLKRQVGTTDAAKKELARDLASLALDGGLLVVGVDEGPPGSLAAQPIADVKERIGHVARDRVQPALRTDVREFLAAGSTDRGYVVVIVPASPDAPHYAEGSYWGRSSAGKVVLRHEEIERRRALRASVPSAAAELLQFEVDRDPTPPTLRTQAHVFVIAEPVLAPQNMLDAKLGPAWERWIHGTLVNRMRGIGEWSPDIGSAWLLTAVPEGYSLRSGDEEHKNEDAFREESIIEMRLTLDGGVRIFTGRGSANARGQRFAVEAVIQGLTARAIQAAAVVAQKCDFRGDWDVGLAVTNLRGVLTSLALTDPRFGHGARPYPADEHREIRRVAASELADPLAIARQLTDGLDRVLNGRRFDITSRR